MKVIFNRSKDDSIRKLTHHTKTNQRRHWGTAGWVAAGSAWARKECSVRLMEAQDLDKGSEHAAWVRATLNPSNRKTERSSGNCLPETQVTQSCKGDGQERVEAS